MRGRSLPAIIAALVAAVLLAACGYGATVRDTVLLPGQSVTASNQSGTVRIVYVGPTTRTFEFNGKSTTIHETPRPKPWDGKLGIYDPADSFGPFPAIRIVCQESVLHFDDLDQAYAFLRSQISMGWVYSPDGLVVGFSRTPERRQVNVDLYQILIRGRKPHDLRGARPAAIHLEGATT